MLKENFGGWKGWEIDQKLKIKERTLYVDLMTLCGPSSVL